MSGIHPAGVNGPVSESLVGRSSYVKLFVRSIERSMFRGWSLRKRKQTTTYIFQKMCKNSVRRGQRVDNVKLCVIEFLLKSF